MIQNSKPMIYRFIYFFITSSILCFYTKVWEIHVLFLVFFFRKKPRNALIGISHCSHQLVVDYFQCLVSLEVVLYFFVAPPSELLLFFWFLKDIHYRDLNDNIKRKRGQQKIDTLCNLQHPGQCTGDSLDKKDYSRHIHEL